MTKKLPVITPVQNNKEKQLTYTHNMNRYNKAYKEGFYLECMFILYAMMEDRLSAFLYHLGFVAEDKRNVVTRSKRYKAEIRAMLSMSIQENRYPFGSFGGKINAIKTVLLQSMQVQPETPLQTAVYKAVTSFAEDPEFLTSLEFMNDDWRNTRNTLIHALMNQKFGFEEEEIMMFLDRGLKAARVVDSKVRVVKKYKIRQKFKIK